MAVRLGRLRTRPEFLRVARTRQSWATPGLVLQAARRSPATDPEDEQAMEIRVGFTASRKVGSAVARNRARRRLRAAAREVLPRQGRPGFDYVLIARSGTLDRPYAALVEDLGTAVEKIAAGAKRRGPGPKRGTGRR